MSDKPALHGESIAILDLGEETFQRAQASGITTIGQLCETPDIELRSRVNFDEDTVLRIRRKLAALGLLLPVNRQPNLGTLEAGILWVAIMVSPFIPGLLISLLAIVLIPLGLRYAIRKLWFGRGRERVVSAMTLVLFSAYILFLLKNILVWIRG